MFRSSPLPIATISGPWIAAALAASVAAFALLMSGAGMTLDPLAPANRAILLSVLLLAVVRFALRDPQTVGQRFGRDLSEYLGVFTLICLLGAAASYPAASDSQGFADARLEHVDRLLHFDWLTWYGVTAAHPALQRLGEIAYESIYLTPVALFAAFAASGRKAEARLFIATFWLAAVLTLCLFVAIPAEGPLAFLRHGPIHYMPESALYQAQIIPILRHHAMHQLSLGCLHGLVCAPSFHTASAFLYIAAAWPLRRLRGPVLAVNIAMLLATPVEGTHYLADMIAGALVALAASLAMNAAVRWQWRGEALNWPRLAASLRQQ